MRNSLRKGAFLSRDEYPVTVSSMYALMKNHVMMYHSPNNNNNNSGNNNNQSNNNNRNGGSRGILLTRQRATNASSSNINNINSADVELVAGNDGNIINATCFCCNMLGHLSYNFPEILEDERAERLERREQGRRGRGFCKWVTI